MLPGAPGGSGGPQLVPGGFPPPHMFFIFFILLNNCRVLRGGGAVLSKTRVLEGSAHPPTPKPEIYRLLRPRGPPGAPPGPFLLKNTAVIKKHVLTERGQ